MVIRPRLIGVWRRLSAQRLDELGQFLGGTCPALGLAGVLGGLLARLSVTLDECFEGDHGQSPWCWRQATRVATSVGVLPYRVLTTLLPCTYTSPFVLSTRNF